MSRDKLNPLLRGMSEDQINETFDSLFRAIKAPAANNATVEPPKPKKEPISSDVLREKFDPNSDKFDPRGAFVELANENYGGLLNDISAKANEGLKNSLRNKLPDFEEHEADIDRMLANVDPSLVNQALMTQTYLAVVGAKEVDKKLKERQKPPTTREPTSRSPEDREAKPKLSDEEKQVARVLFRNSKDPEGDYLKAQKMMDDGYELKVPGEAK